MRDKEIIGLYEAYASIYTPQQEFEGWVNDLLEEGYDLSEYTWDEMYEIYEDYKPWDFGPRDKAKAKHAQLAQRKAAGGSAPGTATRANKIASVGREMRTTLDKDSAVTMTNPKKQGLQPSTPRHTAAALRGAGGGATARTKFDVKPLKPTKSSRGGGSSAQSLGSSSGTRGYQVGGSQGHGISGIKLADSYTFDFFDTILEHLVAEGYADTNEAALVIMANMSEEWRESIVEEVLDERNRGEQGMSDREVTRRRNLGGNVRSRVSASSLGDHGPQSAIQKFHKGKAKQRREIHKSGRGTRGDTGESGGQSRYQANKDHSDGYPSITKRGDGPY